MSGTEVAVGIVVMAALLGVHHVGRRRITWSLSRTLALAALLRVGVALLAVDLTPEDVAVIFRSLGTEVLSGRDPLLSLPRFHWNFTVLVPSLHAAIIELGIPWRYGAKVLPIAADLITVWLVGLLSERDAETRRLQYALHPVALLVVAVHGQVDAIALAAVLGSLLLVRRRLVVPAGVVFGLAVAVKTWPLVIGAAYLVGAPWRQRWRFALAAAAAPAILIFASTAILHSDPIAAVQRLSGYGSYVGYWGWGGALVAGQWVGEGYQSAAARPGTVLLVVAAASTLYLFRRSPLMQRVAAVLLAFVAVTAGFGPQYLLWFTPFVVITGLATTAGLSATTASYAACAYLSVFPPDSERNLLVALSVLPLVSIVACVLTLCAARADETSRSIHSTPSSPG